MAGLGARLQLYIGPTIPTAAPYEVMDALIDLQVTNGNSEFDGFQMSFSLGRGGSIMDYGLLTGGLLDPPNRVIVLVTIGTRPEILIDGLITQHQVMPNNQAGASTLHVTGMDISLKLDLKEEDKPHPDQSDSVIVEQLLKPHRDMLQPDVTKTDLTPSQTERRPTQQGTDLDYIRELARRNGFVFYVEPTSVRGKCTAYWGAGNRKQAAQPPLTMNMGSQTNVDSPINFNYDALGPAAPQVFTLDPDSKQRVPVESASSLHPQLSRQPAPPMRETLPRDTAKMTSGQASLRGRSSSAESSDAVRGTGEVDAVRYGQALRARRLVGVRGVGHSYDGEYYVEQVTHRIKRGEYKQSFTLRREGRGSMKRILK